MSQTRFHPDFVKQWPVNKLTEETVKQLKGHADAVEQTLKILHKAMIDERDKYIAGMAVAFMDATGCSIDEIMLVNQVHKNGDGWSFWFERKTPKPENPN